MDQEILTVENQIPVIITYNAETDTYSPNYTLGDFLKRFIKDELSKRTLRYRIKNAVYITILKLKAKVRRYKQRKKLQLDMATINKFSTIFLKYDPNNWYK